MKIVKQAKKNEIIKIYSKILNVRQLCICTVALFMNRTIISILFNPFITKEN